MPTSNNYSHNSKVYWLYSGLAALWFLVQCLLYSKHGIKVVFDSKRYLAQADLLAAGEYSALKISYIVYTALLAFSNLLGSLAWIILLQIVVSGIAMVAMYKAALKITNSQLTASLTVLLLIIWPDYQFWNLYIHTESLFVSVTCLVFWRLVTADQARHYLQLFLLLVLVLLLRPNGFMVILAVLVYWGLGYCNRKGYPVRKAVGLLLTLTIVGMLAAAHLFLKDISSDHSFTKFLVSGEIIQGYEPLRINIEKQIELQGTPLKQTIAIVLNEPAFFFKKSLMRLLYYWAQIRPYYSLWHNITIVILMYPLYLLGVKALATKKTDIRITGFIVCLMLQFSAMVVVSAVDWDNRFFLPLLPFVFFIGAIGLRGLLPQTVIQKML